MTLHRAYVMPEIFDQIIDRNLLDKESAHRFQRVLRLCDGDSIELFDGEGRVLSGQLAGDKTLTRVKMTKHTFEGPQITIVQAMVKMEKLEQIVQRCTELGVSEFIIFQAERSIVSFKDKATSKLERLTRIAQDAARQSERVFVPRISFSNLTSLSEVTCLVGDPDAQLGLLTWLQNHDVSLLQIVVGPEGGLSPSEMQLLSQRATPVKWARHVLRTETAAMAAVSVIIAQTLP